MKNEIMIGIAILVCGIGAFLFINRPKDIPASQTPQVTSTQTNIATPTAGTMTPITSTEIAKHTDENSCWMVINGNVYDVTTFITSHPGGSAILLGCGKDATDLYNGLSNFGHRHSNRAQSILSQLLVGPLAK